MLAKAQTFLVVVEGTIEFQLIVDKPPRSEVDMGESFVIVKTLGDGLGLLQPAKGLLVSSPEPQHLSLSEENVDPLPLALLSLGKSIETIDDRGAVIQRFGRGEPSRRPSRSPQQVFKRLLIISGLSVVMTEDLRFLIKSTQTRRLECTPNALMMAAPRVERQAFVRDL
jgi:hypothetical protein